MTRSQRRRHLWAWALLGPAVIAFIGLALGARGPEPLGLPVSPLDADPSRKEPP